MTEGAVRHAILADRALLRVGGEGAVPFLQRLVTCEVEGLGPGEAGFGALLSPQGKILFDFHLHRTAEAMLLDVAAAQAEALAARLAFYRLRAPVTIEPAADRVIAVAWRTDGGDPGEGVADARLAALGSRTPVASGDVTPDASSGGWHAHRIALGVPEGGLDYPFGDTFPHEALMDCFGGVDFAKGCYVGQEVVSRMKHRGTARRRVVSVRGAGPLPPPGTEVTVGERVVGLMGSSDAMTGLALLRLDRVVEARAAGEAILAGTVPVEPSIPAWTGLAWPEA